MRCSASTRCLGCSALGPVFQGTFWSALFQFTSWLPWTPTSTHVVELLLGICSQSFRCGMRNMTHDKSGSAAATAHGVCVFYSSYASYMGLKACTIVLAVALGFQGGSLLQAQLVCTAWYLATAASFVAGAALVSAA